MNPIHKLIYTLIASLTLLLIGCGGSSSTSTSAITELEQIQKAAKDAYDTAAKKATDANTSAEDAKTATMNLMTLSTDTMTAAEHVRRANDAAEAARMARDKAKAESDKAAAATTVEVARTARDEAVKQAGIADDKQKEAAAEAQKAKEAAMMELSYADGMYKVGDQSIMPGALKKEIETTMANGKTRTQTIGLVKNISSTAHTKRPAVVYRAKTATTPERKAQPAVAMRRIKVGKVIDSDDDMTRLRLVDKYVGTGMVRVLGEGPMGGSSPAAEEGSVIRNHMARSTFRAFLIRKAGLTLERSSRSIEPRGGSSIWGMTNLMSTQPLPLAIRRSVEGLSPNAPEMKI